MKAIQKYAIVPGFAVAFLVLLELSLRFFLPPPFRYYRALKDLHESHPDYLVALSPNADVFIEDNKGLWEGRFRTNSMAMRGSREIIPKSPKLACLGDSIVMGFGVSDEEAFCTLLDGLQIQGRRYQSLNLSVDAFGSRGYALRLDEVSQKTDLDVVLLFVSPNDYTMPKDLRARGIRPDDESDAVRFSDPAYLRMFRYRFFLTKHSYLAHALLVSLQQMSIRSQLLFQEIRRGLIHAGFLTYDKTRDGKLRHKPGLWNYIRYAFYRPPPKASCLQTTQKKDIPPTSLPPLLEKPKKPPPVKKLTFFTRTDLKKSCPEAMPAHLSCVDFEPKELPELLPQTRLYYDEMIRLSKKQKFLLLPVFLPIQDEALYCTLAARHAPLYNYALRAKRYFESKGIRTMDLRAYLSGACNMKKEDGTPIRVRDLYILGDGHYTKYGNRWAARAIATALRDFFRAGKSKSYQTKNVF